MTAPFEKRLTSYAELPMLLARTLKHLSDTEQMPTLLRTIRFIGVPESAGTWAWFSPHFHQRLAPSPAGPYAAFHGRHGL